MRGHPQLGDLVAGYRIERQIGRGGMGVVYLAEQPRLRRRVALKLIAPELAEDDDFRRRFERESQLAASIDHPNVIPVYEAGDADGSLFISMRYVEGSDLRGLIRQAGHIDAARAAWITSQVAAALDAAHAHGLVHRDVKPANVLVTGPIGSEHAYLTDFGLTKHVSSSSGITHTGQWVGTLDYVAPEQISGGPLDARVDVYSLGCVLYEALTGHVPYPKESDVAKMYAHLNELPAPVASSVPGLPSVFDTVVHRALAKAPEDRYPSAGDLGRAALAAADNQFTTVPERSVAAGNAALVADRPTAPAPAPTQWAPPPQPPTQPAYETGPTARLPVSSPPVSYPPAPPPPARRSSPWPIVAAVVVVLALGGAAAALIAGGAFSNDSSNSTTVIVRRTVPGSTTPQQQPSTRAGVTGYSSSTYSAEYPAGWNVVEDDVDKGAYSETKFMSPDGATTVLIDRTPGSPIDPETAAASVEAATSKTPGYKRVAWEPVDLAGNAGWRWVFDLPSGRRVDYFTNAGGGRFAVLGHGGDFATADATARQVAESLQAK